MSAYVAASYLRGQFARREKSVSTVGLEKPCLRGTVRLRRPNPRIIIDEPAACEAAGPGIFMYMHMSAQDAPALRRRRAPFMLCVYECRADERRADV